VLEILAEYEARGGRVITLRSRRATDEFLRTIPVAAATPTAAPTASSTALYFAYGSNLSSERMRRSDRAPSARIVGTAALSGHVLAWHKRGADGTGKCTIRPTGSRADGVWGVLWEIDAADVERLDAVEGPGYERVDVEVTTANQKMSAFSYRARTTYVDEALRPADWYREVVLAGAREHGLPAAWIRSLEGASAVTWSGSSVPIPPPAPSPPDATPGPRASPARPR
jgi:hypothetical protein